MPLRKLTLLALYTTLSLGLYAVESMVPPLVPIPGMKLGLSNLITLVLLRHYTPRDAALVLLSRILLSTLLFGQAMSFLYSLAGGIFSLAVMLMTNRMLNRKYPYLTGASGGLAHNIAQLAVAFLLTGTQGVLVYLPLLLSVGILTGAFTGFLAMFSERHLASRLPGE